MIYLSFYRWDYYGLVSCAISVMPGRYVPEPWFTFAQIWCFRAFRMRQKGQSLEKFELKFAAFISLCSFSDFFQFSREFLECDKLKDSLSVFILFVETRPELSGFRVGVT